MPKRTDLKKIMVIGSGPIVIGQSCEFDYSGTQACKALRDEGYKVILVNSNPATIMTDPATADRTYVEPLTPAFVESILRKERPDALLPTMGGQTGLNIAMALSRSGVLKRLGVELIGADEKAIAKAEDRELFKKAMRKIGLNVPESATARTLAQALATGKRLGYPVVIRPAFTLGGIGGGIAMTEKECRRMAAWGLAQSPVSQVLIEKSVMGWKEYELEVMRDTADNVVIICSIENFDPMGVHTGDSVTVAPAQTLTDAEYQAMRDDAAAIIREIGVATGGSNIQFAVNPRNGERIVIEMNPRVSRSSALASKATGFPIAKIAAKLAVGYRLDEVPNDITKETPACFEPTLDYVVTKIPRFTFEKFPETDDALTTQMKSVGEVMAIGRTFKESFQKALRSLEIGLEGFGGGAPAGMANLPEKEIRRRLAKPNSQRLPAMAEALRRSWTVRRIQGLSAVDPWFLEHLKDIVDLQKELARKGLRGLDRGLLRKAKSWGMSDRQLGRLSRSDEAKVRALRRSLGVRPAYRMVDTCGAEFEAKTPYLYSSYDAFPSPGRVPAEAPPSSRRKVMILGGGPTRIGQGIEFDYMCVHGAFTLRDLGYEVLMVNCNPETVSTDYDTSDRLFFEPLTLEDVLEIHAREKPFGVVVQFGGQTPLKLTGPLDRAGVRILGTPPSEIERAEDRKLFERLIRKLGLRQAEGGIAYAEAEARAVAARIGYPVLVRPSWVLGGRAMQIVFAEAELNRYMKEAVRISDDEPILVDKYLEGATEVDVDAVSDGRDVLIAGVMEHIEEAGIHSGDSACALPSFSLAPEIEEELRDTAKALAKALKVVGLLNVQFAVKDKMVFVLEANPRASRTVPFVSKVTGIPWAKVAARCMVGRTLASQKVRESPRPRFYGVKEAVFPFTRFPGVDTVLGPEMKSTGEVMGLDSDFPSAYAKSQIAAGTVLPTRGRVLISVHERQKRAFAPLARELASMGFDLAATRGTADFLASCGVRAKALNKVGEEGETLKDWIDRGRIHLVLNAPEGQGARADGATLRRAALLRGVPYVTTLAGAQAAVQAIRALRSRPLGVRSIQDYHRELRRG